jgi:hypothetical protein
MDTFEIIVFDNEGLHDRTTCERQEVVKEFATRYSEHFDYADLNITFERGKLYLRCSDRKKNMVIMLLGWITSYLIDEIMRAIKN